MSERGFSSTLNTELSSANASLVLLLYLDWPGGAGRYWSGVGTLSYDGESWLGAGELGSIDKFADSIEKTDTGIELVLDFLDSTIRDEVVANDPVGQDASLYLCSYSGGSITSAYELFPGFIDEVNIVDEGTSGRITVRLASELARLSRSRIFFLSDAHQQYLFAGDLGMEFAPRMNQGILWGRKPVLPSTPGGYPITPDDPFYAPPWPYY